MIRRKAPKSIGGRKAGEDHARSQCPEKHPGTQGAEERRRTQGCLRQEARPTSSGSEAAAQEVMLLTQEASQVNRQLFTVLRQE
ncbi:hypothetical protein RJ60_11745 [Mesotoga sp. B105.6.4]|nr:hypothetical protein RJ60_11745 [Mesotoga sp. B105.6.4]